jgi:hypothetical protein
MPFGRRPYRNSTANKAAYVTGQSQTRKHECHWPDCKEQVPPAMWGCKKHWFKLPAHLRRLVWANYRPGQEVDMRPSSDYVRVARTVQEWIAQHGKD